MQKIQAYNDSITLGSTSKRTVSYGKSTTQTLYVNKVDFFNQTVADFLSDCGVDAAYESRGVSEDKFLWIYGVPFLFTPKSSGTSGNANETFNLYYPYDSTPAVTTSVDIFSAYNKNDYSFYLIFTGNPKTGFVLRNTTYTSNAPTAASIIIRFMRTVNTINGKNGLAWSSNPGTGIPKDDYTSFTESDFTQYALYYHIAEPIDNIIEESTYSPNTANSSIYFITRDIDKQLYPGKIPLVQVKVGEVRTVPGVYHIPSKNYQFPASESYNSILQTETEIDGRRFIVMSGYSFNTSKLNLPIIEVTDEGETNMRQET